MATPKLSDKEIVKNIETHLEMMMDSDMKDCADYSENDSLDMKIFWILQGFARKIEEVKELKSDLDWMAEMQEQ